MRKKTIRLGLLHTTIRMDEKLLLEAAQKRAMPVEVIDVRECIFSPNSQFNADIVLERCISTLKGINVLEYFTSIQIPTVNTLETARTCDNKFLTSLRLVRANVPTLKFALVFDEVRALEAIEELGGYPVVIKPVSGSWGRLLAKINDRDALEGVLEQKLTLGGPHQHSFYLQKYIEKPGRDIRVNVVNGRVVAAIYRETSHWITNTARGAEAKPCTIDKDLGKISLATAKAVGGGVLGIDVFETKGGYLINEINHTTEFKNVQRVTGIDVAGAIIDYCKEEVIRHD